VTYAKHTDWTVERVIHTEYLEDLFHLPLSQQAFGEFQSLEVICQNALAVVQEGMQIVGPTFGEMQNSLPRKHIKL
jgi:hypothetical protein